MVQTRALFVVSVYLTGVLGAVIQKPIFDNDVSSQGNIHFPITDPALVELEADLPRLPDNQPRIKMMYPVAMPCYSRSVNGAIAKDDKECARVTGNRTSDVWMTNQPGSYFFGNWGSCQRTGETCVMPTKVDGKDPSLLNGAYISNSSICHQGSVPEYYIDVWGADDVKAVFNHSRNLNRPIVIKNTGHDWRGRSSGPRALALWTHNLQWPRTPRNLLKNFSPESCNDGVSDEYVLQFGAGEQWGGVYDFANDHRLTVMGGTCPTVGVAGWLHGGGHSPLSPAYGMGVDNVRQVRIVTPNGEELIANRCQNKELFDAVKGGGPSTFGVVLELWYKALPRFEVQEFTLSFWGLDVSLTRRFIEILAENANEWASKGWGGYINTVRQDRSVTIVNPTRSLAEATADMQPLTSFAARVQARAVIKTHASWAQYFEGAFGNPTYHQSTWGAAVASRLVPPRLLDDAGARGRLVDVLLDLHYSRVNFIIMPVTPAAFPASRRQTSSLHPSWRNATWLIRINDRWDSFYEAATAHTNHKNFERVHRAMHRIRELTPDMGVSISEADIWEPRHELSFWGAENFEALRSLKSRVDPDNVLKVLQGVGAKDWEDRFTCYPRQEDF